MKKTTKKLALTKVNLTVLDNNQAKTLKGGRRPEPTYETDCDTAGGANCGSRVDC